MLKVGRSATLLPSSLRQMLAPSWSRDGRWIYFGSNQDGSLQVWKMPAEGGQRIQVTKKGGLEAFESFDGTSIYYSKSDDPNAIWKVPAAGGEETRFLAQHLVALLDSRGERNLLHHSRRSFPECQLHRFC